MALPRADRGLNGFAAIGCENSVDLSSRGATGPKSGVSPRPQNDLPLDLSRKLERAPQHREVFVSLVVPGLQTCFHVLPWPSQTRSVPRVEKVFCVLRIGNT